MLSFILALRYNFDIVSEQTNNYGEPYDFNSIMHYPFNAFAIDRRQNTIFSKNRQLQHTAKPYRELSQSDVTQTKRMYKCSGMYHVYRKYCETRIIYLQCFYKH
jgi:hypothetical protein